MKAVNLSALLRIVGCLAALVGCVWAIRALWSVWAVDGPGPGRVPEQDGWEWMTYGDVALCAACGLAAGLVAALSVGTGSPRAMRGAGVAALLLLAGTLAGVAYVWWVMGLDNDVLGLASDAGRTRAHDRGPGAGEAATGLVIAMSGVVVALAGSSRRRHQPVRRRAPAEYATKA
jgi:hypothetical protein